MSQVMGRMKVEQFKRICDFDGPGHNKIIMPGKPSYQIREGEAQGVYHGPRCYHAALTKYQSLKKQFIPENNE